MGIVSEVDRTHLDHWVVVDELVQAMRPHDERGHDLAPIAFLGGSGHDPPFGQVDDCVGEHLGMDPQVAMVDQGERGGGWNRPDPELDGCAIRDEAGDMLPDPPLDVADDAHRHFIGGDVHLDGEVDCVDMDEALTECPRHRPVELHDDNPSGRDRRLHRLDGHAHGAEAMVIRGRGVDQDRVQR